MTLTSNTEAQTRGPAHQLTRTPSGARRNGEAFSPQQLAQLEYLDVREAAALTRINHEIVRKAIRSGELEAENYGSDRRPIYRIHRDALHRWAESRSTVKAAGGK